MTNVEKYYEQREQEQNFFWSQLRSEFNWLKRHLRASESEIADGLNISRQLVNEFMHSSKKHRDSLPIQRANLLALYDYLTDSTRINEARISKEAKANRQEWHHRGPNKLLIAAGYQPLSKDVSLEYSSSRKRKTHRISSRLGSSWLNDLDIWDIESTILDRIVERRAVRDQFLADPVDDIERWLREAFPHEGHNLKVREKFIAATQNFKGMGKRVFEQTELFELYQNIKENEVLRDDKNFRIRVVSCEFRNISSLFQALQSMDEHKNIFERMCILGGLIESRIRGTNSKYAKDNSIDFQPVKEAKIICYLNKEKSISWFYRSNSTHVENMILALQKGLGSSLILKDLSMRAIGGGSRGLARASVIMGDKNLGGKEISFYQGMWVDLDTLIAISQSIVIAYEDWIKDTITSSSEAVSEEEVSEEEVYYLVCEQIGIAFELLDKARQNLMSYRLLEAQQKCREVFNIFNSLQGKLKVDANLCFQSRLNYLFLMSKWIENRCFHIQGDISKTLEIIEAVQELVDSSNQILPIPVLLLHKVEKIIYSLFSGERAFLVGKYWRLKAEELSLNSLLEQLKVYLQDANTDDIVEPELYRCLSEIYGNIARLEFYFYNKADESPEGLPEDFLYKDETHIEPGHESEVSVFNGFLIASYFAMKLGQGYRVAHWLTHISRLASRLGKYDEAIQYANFASKVISYESRDIHLVTNDIYQLGFSAELALAYGELSFHQGNYEAAIENFINSLDGSIYLGFSRLVGDSLYGIYRVIDQIKSIDKPSKLSFQKKLESFLTTHSEDFSKKHLNIHDSASHLIPEIGLNQELRKRIADIDMTQDYNTVAVEFKELAKSIWRSWVESTGRTHKHPVEEAIDAGWFLNKI